MAYNLNLNKLIKEVRGPKGMAAVTEEIAKLKGELDRIREKVEPQVEQKLKMAQARLAKVKDSVQQAEKRLVASLRGHKATAAKTSKKTSKKAAPKTTKKKASKKTTKKMA